MKGLLAINMLYLLSACSFKYQILECLECSLYNQFKAVGFPLKFNATLDEVFAKGCKTLKILIALLSVNKIYRVQCQGCLRHSNPRRQLEGPVCLVKIVNGNQVILLS